METTEPATTAVPEAKVAEESKKEKVNTKALKEQQKAERLRQRQEQATKKKEEDYKKDPNDPCASKFGDLELNRSQSDPELRYAKKFTQVHELDASLAGQDVIVRGRLHGSRPSGKKLVFIVLREQFATV